jgi:hypothetical protein
MVRIIQQIAPLAGESGGGQDANKPDEALAKAKNMPG